MHPRRVPSCKDEARQTHAVVHREVVDPDAKAGQGVLEPGAVVADAARKVDGSSGLRIWTRGDGWSASAGAWGCSTRGGGRGGEGGRATARGSAEMGGAMGRVLTLAAATAWFAPLPPEFEAQS